MSKTKIYRQLFWGILCYLSSTFVIAAGNNYPLSKLPSYSGDNSAREGAEVMLSTCIMCHSLKYISYKQLLSLGVTPERLDVLRGNNKLEEPILSSMDNTTRQMTFGIIPPDLSLITKTRKHGDRYVYTLLTSFHVKEDGTGDNLLFPGIKMPDALGYSFAEDDQQKAALKQRAVAITDFLTWAADPKAEERHTIGYFVMFYLVILTTLLYLVKKKVWRRLEPV